MAPQKWQTKTIIDMYIEREREPWYWRLLAIIAASLILIGFLVFPQSFSTASDVVASSGTLSVVAVIMLALGYSLSVALWFICRSWLFQLDVIFVPCFISCVMGTLNIAISIGAHSPTTSPWSTASIAALCLALISSAIYALLSFLLFRRVNAVRNGDKSSTRQRYSGSETLTLLPEEELQRQNLLRLLKQKESPRVSPSQSTFRIDIPDNARAARNPLPPATPFSNDPHNPAISHLAAPSATYESASSRGRSTSAGLRGLTIDEQFAFHRGNVQEPAMSSQQATLEAARARTRDTRMREEQYTPPSDSESIGGPPVIVNTRRYTDDIAEIPLSERHPLERDENYIAGDANKDKQEFENLYDGPGVYRPEDQDYGGHDYEEDEGPTYEIVDGADIDIDLENAFTRNVPVHLRSPISIISPNSQHEERPHSGHSIELDNGRKQSQHELDGIERKELDSGNVRS